MDPTEIFEAPPSVNYSAVAGACDYFDGDAHDAQVLRQAWGILHTARASLRRLPLTMAEKDGADLMSDADGALADLIGQFSEAVERLERDAE